MNAWCLSLIFLAGSSLPGVAQAPGVPIEVNGEWSGPQEIIAEATALKKAGKLTGQDAFLAMLAKPSAQKVTLPPVKSLVLSRAEVYEVARRSRVRVGWFYLCRECKDWHVDLAGGYALTDDGVIATCQHVAAPLPEMAEGYLIVVDASGKVCPVIGVIASSENRDTTVLRASGGNFRGLPLNDQVRPGDAAYCLSDPLGNNGYFSEGMVNRFYRQTDGAGTAAEQLRLNVSTEWAPGSSGSPVLDQCGNAMGHVSMITALTEDPEEEEADDKDQPKAAPGKTAGGGKSDGGKPAESPEEGPLPPGTQIVLHEACPSRSVRQLLEAATTTNQEAAPAGPAGP